MMEIEGREGEPEGGEERGKDRRGAKVGGQGSGGEGEGQGKIRGEKTIKGEERKGNGRGDMEPGDD